MDGLRANAPGGQLWCGWLLTRITSGGGGTARGHTVRVDIAGRPLMRLARDQHTVDEPPGWSDEHDPRRNNLDLLRFVLASLVVLSHSYSITLPKPLWVREPLLGLTGRQVSLGTLSVYGFFAISGFLIARSWVRCRSFGQFLGKRALRLYPGFAAMTLFCVFVAVPLATGASPDAGWKSLAKVAYRVLVFDAWEDPAAFAGNLDHADNASAWTIPYEFWCYVALAAVATVGALGRRRWLGVALFAVAYAFHQAFAAWNCGPVWAQLLPRELASHVTRIVGVPAKWPEFLTYFFAGMVLATWRDRIPHSAKWAAACAGVLVAAAVTRPLMHYVLSVCGVYLLFWFALHTRLRNEGFGRHGDFSYGI